MRRWSAAATVYCARCPGSHSPARRARSPSLRTSACHGRIQAVLAHHTSHVPGSMDTTTGARPLATSLPPGDPRPREVLPERPRIAL